MTEGDAVSGISDPETMLRQLESYAEQMFGNAPQHVREAATKQLAGFSSSRDFLPQCRFLLSHSRSHYALLLASQSLVKLTTEFWNSFTTQEALELSAFCLSVLASRLAQIPPFVVPYLIQTICRVAKLGWITDPLHKQVVTEILAFLQQKSAAAAGNTYAQQIIEAASNSDNRDAINNHPEVVSVQHFVIGLNLFAELVQDINTMLGSQTVMQHRKIAVAFRDQSLLDIFQFAVTTLDQIIQNQFPAGSLDALSKIKTAALKLSLKCLNFDFIGTTPDEPSDEFGSLQIPTEWRHLIEDSACTHLFFRLAYQSKAADAQACMEILVQLASCRRSLFSKDTSRKLYLEVFCAGTVTVIEDQASMFLFCINPISNSAFRLHF
jgi:exportin-7